MMGSIFSRAARASAAGRVALGTVHLMLGCLVLMATGYGVTVIIARGLDPSQYGIYGVIVSVVLRLDPV